MGRFARAWWADYADYLSPEPEPEPEPAPGHHSCRIVVNRGFLQNPICDEPQSRARARPRARGEIDRGLPGVVSRSDPWGGSVTSVSFWVFSCSSRRPARD